MKKNQKGFSIVEILVIIVVLGVVVAVGWLVYDRQKAKSTDTTTSNVTTEVSDLKGEVSYIETEVPGAWTEQHQQGSQIYSLVDDKLGCYVAVGIDRPKTDLSSVQPLAGTPNREVILGSGQKVTIYESGPSKEYLVSEGYVVENDFNAVVTVACKDKADYSTADLGLKGLSLE